MTRPETCFYCACPASYRHTRASSGRSYEEVGWCEHHYWHGTDLPCPDCDIATEDVA